MDFGVMGVWNNEHTYIVSIFGQMGFRSYDIANIERSPSAIYLII